MVKVFGNVDTNELAARLGALSVEDRRGNIIWSDSFEGVPDNWYIDAAGAGASLTKNATHSWLGSSCMKIVTGTENAQAQRIQKGFAAPMNSRIGIELHFFPPGAGYIFLMQVWGYNGTHSYTGILEFNQTDDKVYIHDSAGASREIQSYILNPAGQLQWQYAKLVFDWKTMKYVRAIYNENEYDISTYGLRSAVNATNPCFSVWLWVVSQGTTSHNFYIDDFILTQNEP